NLQAETRYKDQAVSVTLKGDGDFASFNIDDALIKLGNAQLKTSGNIRIEQQKLDLQIHQLSGPVQIIEVFDVPFPDDLLIDINETKGALKGVFTSPEYSGYTQ